MLITLLSEGLRMTHKRYTTPQWPWQPNKLDALIDEGEQMNTNMVDWESAPAWASVIACNAYGAAWWYEAMPRFADGSPCCVTGKAAPAERNYLTMGHAMYCHRGSQQWLRTDIQAAQDQPIAAIEPGHQPKRLLRQIEELQRDVIARDATIKELRREVIQLKLAALNEELRRLDE